MAHSNFPGGRYDAWKTTSPDIPDPRDDRDDDDDPDREDGRMDLWPDDEPYDDDDDGRYEEGEW